MKLLIGIVFAFIKISLFPSLHLLFWMAAAIAADFVTGVIKAIVLKQARTSSGYRKTITKFLQYGGSLFVGLALSNATKNNVNDQLHLFISYLNDGLVVFIIYIEVTSIFENIYACDKESPLSKYMIAPALKILTWQLKNNPVIKQSETITQKPQ